MTDMSAEVAAMQSAERKKWLTVAEGQRVRKHWSEIVDAMDKVIEKYDEDPENEQEALMLVLIGGLTVSGFMQTASDAGKQLRALMETAPGV